MEQELLTHPEHTSSPPVFSGICVAPPLVSNVVFCKSLFVRFVLAIVLSVRHQFAASDYTCGTFNFFLQESYNLSIAKRSLRGQCKADSMIIFCHMQVRDYKNFGKNLRIFDFISNI